MWVSSSSEMVLCVPRSSVCELEVDAVAADILNRQELSLGNCNNRYDQFLVGIKALEQVNN